MPRFALLSKGKLFVADSDGSPAVSIDSPFADKAIRTAQEVEQQKAWKNKTMMNAMGVDTSGMPDGSRVHVIFSAACCDPNTGGLLYLMQTESAGGLFHMAADQKEEQRLFHTQDFLAHGLTRHRDTGFLACSLQRGEGNACIMVMNDDGTERREVTGGDCRDASPSWVPGQDYRIVYESAGIGRNEQGFVVGLGPSAICRIDLKTREIETLAEDPRFDYLAPRQTETGDLLYIRRPYESIKNVGFGQLIMDGLLFPFRLAGAFLHFLNAFSMLFSQKPLITSTGQQMNREQQAGIMLRGRWIETKRKLREGEEETTRSLVPDNWELVRRAPDGQETVLSKGVLSFDVLPEGVVYTTNGRAIFRLDPTGKRELMAKHALIEEFCLIGE